MSWTYQRVFAREFTESTMVDGERGLCIVPSIITPYGVVCTHLYCAGALLERHGRRGESMHARLADPTGVFDLYIDRTNQATAEILESIDLPCFATITGEPIRVGQVGTWKCTVRVREIREVDRSVRDAWILRTANLTLRRIEDIRAVISREKIDARTLTLIDTFRLDIPRLRSMALQVKDAIRVVDTGEPSTSQEGDPAAIILGIIREHGGKAGVTMEEVTRKAARQGMSALEVEKVVLSLLQEDECYQPTRGVLKPL